MIIVPIKDMVLIDGVNIYNYFINKFKFNE